MVLRLLAASLFVLSFAGDGALAQAPSRAVKAPPAAPRPVKPALAIGTAGILAGDAGGTGLKMSADLARLLDNGNALRILPIAGKGSVQSLNDLRLLQAADIAIVQADSLAPLIKAGKQSAASRLQYIAKLHSEEFHILSRMQFLCLQDLTGRRVSFGPKDSGESITAEAVFAANNLTVDRLYLDHAEAVERLKRGELDALVHVGGKPSGALDTITHKDKVHFLDVDYAPGLQANYLPAVMTAEDYPNLIAPDESVGTIAVSMVMVVRTWPPQSERHRVLSRFTAGFFSAIDKLKTGSYSPKWRDVDIRAQVKGLQRSQPAEQWLVANAAEARLPPADQQVKTLLQRFGESQRGGSAGREDLFNQFVRWYRKQIGQPSQH